MRDAPVRRMRDTQLTVRTVLRLANGCEGKREIIFCGMAIRDALLPEFDHEMGTTRRLLERAPAADFSWTPHEKSFNLGQLASHVSNIPHWCELILQTTVFDVLSAGDTRPKAPASAADLVSHFDKTASAARSGLSTAGDPELLTPWTFSRGEQVMFTMPRIAAIRSFVMNHLIHHRGQLSVYLRLRNVPLPPMYGPTADEQ
jgi:uncharacterized damage-inducible protein DinB